MSLCTFSTEVYANSGKDRYITIVNPVRDNSYTVDLIKNLESQSKVVNSYGFSATWLLTYDVIDNQNAVDLLKSFGRDQELGIFLEVTPKYSEKAEVIYNKGGSWHSANGIFLSGYRQAERIKLIDTVFSKFKDKFGYYPTSVGSWWTDSYSLSYMKEKYGITANLLCSDQFSTDGYQIWGQYWMQPYYPSRLHAGIPAGSTGAKLDIVNMQWAPRDPLSGYYNSLYSAQDYSVDPVKQNISYFGKIIELYTSKNINRFGHAVVGLESDLSPHAYEGEFNDRMSLISKLSKNEGISVVSMAEFSLWYRSELPGVSPVGAYVTDDLLGNKIKVIWYQTPFYRIGLLVDSEKEKVKIFDFRTYSDEIIEPYFLTPNRQYDLSIYIPSLLDEVNREDDVWILEIGKLKDRGYAEDVLTLTFDRGEITFEKEKIYLKGVDPKLLPVSIVKSETVTVKNSESGLTIEAKAESPFLKEGVIYMDLSAEATHLLKTKKMMVILFLGVILSIATCIFTILSKKALLKRILLLILPITIVVTFCIWYKGNIKNYLIDQNELEMLWRLSILPPGKVMVYDNECLQCEFYGEYKPPAFANKRRYVQIYGLHPIVYNRSVFEAKDQKSSGKAFKNMGVTYVYLVKYGEYVEKLPFSPGDLGVEKLYDNAYAEIWKKVE